MGMTKVFRFRYFDRASGTMRLAEDWATERAIAEIGGHAVADTEVEVDAAEVSATAGLLMAGRGAC